MAAGLVNKTVGDGNAGTFSATFVSDSGALGGNMRPATTLYSSANTEIDFTTGTAGSPAGGVSSVQGVSGGTPLPVTGPGGGAFTVATTITRPANVTAYGANSVLGGAQDLGVLGPNAGNIMITGVQLEADIAAIPAGQTSWVLYLYNVTPPSALGNTTAWDLSSGDRASFLGSIGLTTLIDLGSTLYMEYNGINKQVQLSGTHLFGYLVTVGGFTPNANSEVYKVTVHTVSL